MPDILVYVLHHDGAFNLNSLGALSEAADRAAELGGVAHAAVLGGPELDDALLTGLGRFGAATVFRGTGTPGLAGPVVDLMDAILTAQGQRYVLFGGGLLGFEIAGGLAARRHAGLVSEVIRVEVDAAGVHADESSGTPPAGAALLAHRPILGDREVSVSRFRGELGIVIARINAFDARESDRPDPVIVDVRPDYRPHSLAVKITRRGEGRGAPADLDAAETVVAVGRGFGSAENLGIAEDLAAAFGTGSAVAATRAVVDAGWAPYGAQIGQTGKTVAPRLYLAAGISGAVQHRVGMEASEHIVAINKDANAPIFGFSDLGIVGDLNKILPKLADAIRTRRH